MGMSDFISLGVGVLAIASLVVVAVILLNGKGVSMIAGWNFKSEEEKAKYDQEALCRFVGWVVLVFALGMALSFIGFYIEMAWLS